MKRNLLLMAIVVLMPAMSISAADAKSRAPAPTYDMLQTQILQTQDEWYVDSGRYVNGLVPSYYRYQARPQNLYLATRDTRRRDGAIERRTGTIVNSEGYLATDREAFVRVI